MLMSQATSVMAGSVFLLRLIISDAGTRAPSLKSKDTSLGRGASKIKTGSVTVTGGCVNWQWQCQISPEARKRPLAGRNEARGIAGSSEGDTFCKVAMFMGAVSCSLVQNARKITKEGTGNT